MKTNPANSTTQTSVIPFGTSRSILVFVGSLRKVPLGAFWGLFPPPRISKAGAVMRGSRDPLRARVLLPPWAACTRRNGLGQALLQILSCKTSSSSSWDGEGPQGTAR